MLARQDVRNNSTTFAMCSISSESRDQMPKKNLLNKFRSRLKIFLAYDLKTTGGFVIMENINTNEVSNLKTRMKIIVCNLSKYPRY